MRVFLRLALSLLVLSSATSSIAADEPAPPASEPAASAAVAAKPVAARFAIAAERAEYGDAWTPFCVIRPARRVPPGSRVIVVRSTPCRTKYSNNELMYYQVIYKGETAYMAPHHLVDIDEVKKDIDAFSEAQIEASMQDWRALSEKTREQEVRAAAAAILATEKYGVTLVWSSIYDVSEHTEGTGAKFTVMNPTKTKTIKYVTVNFVGLNAVMDPVRTLRGTASIRGIGPIEPGRFGSYSRDYMWMTDNVEHHRISSILVEYMDGTKANITDPKKVSLSRFHAELLKDDD